MNYTLKAVFFLLVSFCNLESYCQPVKYQLSQSKGVDAKNLVHIEMTFQSDKSGVTKLLLPDKWTDADHLFENIVNVILKNKETQNVWLIDSALPFEKYIISPPNTELKLTYDLIDNSQHNFKPHINEKYFSFIGKTAFIVPELQGDNESNNIILEWLVPEAQKSYRLVNSYGIDQKCQKISKEELLEGIFQGGDLFISLHGDGDHKIIFSYSQEYSTRSNYEKDAVNLIMAQRLAMQDNNIPYYFIPSIIELDKIFSATHLKNSVLFVYGDDWLSLPRDELIRHMAHEFFHYWIGHKIKASNDYLSSMWFFEGFNDFISIELAFQSEFLRENAYVDIKNRLLKAHYVSPFQAISNKNVALYYWDNPELHGAPYIKGHLFAQFCDQILKEKNRSLLDVISLLSQPNSPYYKERFTEKDLINALANLVSLDIYEAYVKYFIKCECFGDEIDLKLKGYPLDFVNFNMPNYNLNVVATFIENRIIGLSKENELYRLGFRDGWPISNMKIDPLLKTEFIEVDIFDPADKLKKIVLKPYHYSLRIPAFKQK
ncbi:hypothetical protein CC99x_003495 [Candidatus Berkiella cookevillensis]|uniref:Peptidase M1 membrane alanine aminopeptidase domain-containing protein n=1 Tax=Candidatus Berkiella cookevillensis TaxID=437022 RepID=A0A0Q9YKP9_9GAMM|nr:hypothetical protein [Candidatus Berkiella cookevillensis]MCS5707962.1 hypothetical protein [Candidatus Berkiella cookevillensis]